MVEILAFLASVAVYAVIVGGLDEISDNAEYDTDHPNRYDHPWSLLF